MYHTMVDILDHSLLTSLKHDSDIVNLFLYGHKDLSHKRNELIFKMALTYINSSERFSLSTLQQGGTCLGYGQPAHFFPCQGGFIFIYLQYQDSGDHLVELLQIQVQFTINKSGINQTMGRDLNSQVPKHRELGICNMLPSQITFYSRCHTKKATCRAVPPAAPIAPTAHVAPTVPAAPIAPAAPVAPTAPVAPAALHGYSHSSCSSICSHSSCISYTTHQLPMKEVLSDIQSPRDRYLKTHFVAHVAYLPVRSMYSSCSGTSGLVVVSFCPTEAMIQKALYASTAIHVMLSRCRSSCLWTDGAAQCCTP